MDGVTGVLVEKPSPDAFAAGLRARARRRSTVGDRQHALRFDHRCSRSGKPRQGLVVPGDSAACWWPSRRPDAVLASRPSNRLWSIFKRRISHARLSSICAAVAVMPFIAVLVRSRITRALPAAPRPLARRHLLHRLHRRRTLPSCSASSARCIPDLLRVGGTGHRRVQVSGSSGACLSSSTPC